MQDEGILQRGIPQALVASAHAAMAGFQVGLEQQQMLVSLAVAQLGHPFRRFPVLLAGIVIAGYHQ